MGGQQEKMAEDFQVEVARGVSVIKRLVRFTAPSLALAIAIGAQYMARTGRHLTPPVVAGGGPDDSRHGPRLHTVVQSRCHLQLAVLHAA